MSGAKALRENELVEQFRKVTAANEQTARYYLDACGWNLSLATQTFFDSTEADTSESKMEQAKPYSPIGNFPYGAGHPTPPTTPPIAGGGKTKTKTKKPAGKRSGVATLRDLASEDNEDEDEEQEQTFFTGGEKSGIAVADPKQKGAEDDSLLSNILKKAREQTQQQPPEKKEKSEAFGGGGYRLGSASSSSVSASPSSVKPSTKKKEEEEVIVKKITFWKQGYSIDDGEFEPYDSEKGKTFMNCLNNNTVPPQFNKPGALVEFHLEDRKKEDYKPPPKKFQAFDGGGMTLGSVPANKPSQASSTVSSPSVPVTVCDPSKPTTSVQIRLHDGTRMISKFNLTQTVGDIKAFIRSSRPEAKAFSLETTFPTTVLSDDSVTIEEGKLQNAVVVVRLT